VATGDVYRVIVGFDNTFTQRPQSFRYFLRETVGGDPSTTQIGSKVKAWWNDTQGALTPVKAVYTSAQSLAIVKVQKISPAIGIQEEYTTGLPIAGTASGDNIDPNTAILHSFRTAVTTRRGRGRIFLPTPSESVVSNTLLTTTDAANLASKFRELAELHLSVDGMEHVVWSATAASANAVTVWLCDRRPRTQRRRNPRATLYVTGT
jgi:hypothetical protein